MSWVKGYRKFIPVSFFQIVVDVLEVVPQKYIAIVYRTLEKCEGRF